MARPQKRGMDYFPMDVNAGRSVEYIRMRYGLTGFGVIVRLWQGIFAEGYYTRFDEDALLFFAADNRIDEALLREIILFSAEHGVFDEQLYKEKGILTSKEIQERYFSAVCRRGRVDADSRFLLISPEECGPNFCLDGVFVNRNTVEPSVSEDNNTQKKENKRKEKETIRNINQTKPKETTQNETEIKSSSLQSKEAIRLAGLFSQVTGKKTQSHMLEAFLDALGKGMQAKQLEQLIYQAAKRQDAEIFLENTLMNSRESP